MALVIREPPAALHGDSPIVDDVDVSAGLLIICFIVGCGICTVGAMMMICRSYVTAACALHLVV